jgi:DNA polymerase I-like protein with 3'-5' exonuclease and polymerase domains
MRLGETLNLIPQGIILDEYSLNKAVDYFLTQDAFSFDCEAAYDFRDDPNRNTLTWISLATHGCCIVVPMGHEKGEETGTTKITAYYKTGAKAGQPYNKTVKTYSPPPEQLDRATVFEILRPLFASTTIIKSGYDMIYDLISVAKHLGFVPPPPYFDPKIAFWLVDENRFTRGLKEMTEFRYDFKYDFENVGKCVEAFPFSIVSWYSFCDSKFDFFHYLYLKEELAKQNLESVFSLEMDVLNVLIGMRMEGAPVDVEKIRELRDRLTKELAVVKADLYRAAGRKFNMNSPMQKQDILFGPKDEGGQGLKPFKLTDGGKKAKKLGQSLTIRHYSTDDTVLETFQGNAVVDKLREYGDISKILTTYVGSWLGDAENEPKIVDGKIYAGFLQYGTVTGRFSSRKPNLQNIPRSSTELGKLIRSVFIAEPGRTLICADYSQIELVVLAHYLEEGALYEGFLQGIDPHTMTAAMVLGKEPNDISSEERTKFGKSINFAVVYGAGPTKVAAMAGTDVKSAKKFLATHAAQFPEIYDFKDGVIQWAKKRKPEPFITTLLGRKRRVPDILSNDEGRRLGAERQLFNSLIQGGAADVMKYAMPRVDVFLPDECRIHLQVHDELTISCPDDRLEEAVDAVYRGMTGPGIQKFLKVPLKIDLHTGLNWSEVK